MARIIVDQAVRLGMAMMIYRVFIQIGKQLIKRGAEVQAHVIDKY